MVGNKSHTPFDSRLLLSLVKCEKEVADSFKSYTQTCENANNALNGWAAADTGDSPDVLAASNRVCELFDETFDAQRTYLMALNNYRSSLKDVAAREAEIRVILRDRDIFVSRLVKLNNKKPPTSDSAFEAHTAKLEEARAELAACESTLKAEERALVGVKRRIFREALRMRMRAMAQLADTWRDSAERAIDILDTLDADNNPNGSMTDVRLRPQPPPPTQLNNTPMRHSRPETFQSPEGSVIAPSHSASQVARRAAGIPADYSDDEGDTALGGVRDNASSLHRSVSMQERRPTAQVAAAPIAEVSHEEEMAHEGLHMQNRANTNNGAGRAVRNNEDEEEGGGSSEDERGREMDPKMYQVHVNKPLTPRELAQQKARQLMAQKQGEDSGIPVQQMQQQQQQQAVSPPLTQMPVQTNGAVPKSAMAKKKVSATPVMDDTANVQPERATSPGRETAEDRQKRFSTLNLGSTVPAYEAAPAGFVIPSANTFTVDAHKKKHAPEATLLLPSSVGARGYQASRQQDSDDEAADEVGNLKSARRRTASMGTPARPSQGRTFSGDGGSADSDGRERRVLKSSRAPSNRDSAYYSRSDAGTSTLRGADKRDKSDKREKQRSDGHKSGFFGAVSGLFKRRDFQSRQYGDDDDDEDDSVLGSPKSRGTAAGRHSERSGSVFGKKKEKKTRAGMDDSDSDAPDPRTLIRVQNDGRSRAFSSGARSESGIDRSTEAAIAAAVNSNTFTSAPSARKKAMSDVSAPRVKRKSTTGIAAPAPGLERKSSVKSTATVASGVTANGTVKKKKKVVPAGTSSLAASASAPSLSRQGSAMQTPSQRVTRDTPSLMSVVAPPSQSATILNMSLPSAKNPGLSAGSRLASPASSAIAAPKSPITSAGEPLKKKKTVKRSSTISNVNGALLSPSGLKSSSTTPNLLTPQSNTTGTLKPATRPQSALAAPRPASILSVGSAPGANGLTRRKSVRLADDTKIGDATYENSGRAANIPRVPSPQPAPVSSNTNGQTSILKPSTSALHDYNDSGVTGGAGIGEWTRARDEDVSSDEGGDEYARIKHELSRAEKSWQEAGFLNKGKGRAY